jgi:uncharacterized protein (TIGR02271 family)
MEVSKQWYIDCTAGVYEFDFMQWRNIMTEPAESHEKNHPAEADERVTINVHEEVLTPITRDVQLGDVVIHKRVEEEPFEAIVEMSRDEITVKHVPVNREIDTSPEPRYEGDTLVIPVVEEVLVTEKRLVLREELHITRSRRIEQAEIHDVLHREVVDIQEHASQSDTNPTR